MIGLNSFSFRRSRRFIAAAALSVLFAFAAYGSDQVPLKGNFEGTGPNFAGKFTHLGIFAGVFDPNTFTAVWTAANGDTVTNQTISFLLTEEISPGVFTYNQYIVITGGTGRFVGATGSATAIGTINLNTGAFDGYLVGTISRPNSG